MRSETAGDFREFYLAQGRWFVGSDIDDQAILITRSRLAETAQPDVATS